MAGHLRCVNGHDWEIPEGQDDSTSAVQVVCPVCGAAIDEQVTPTGERGVHSGTATHVPASPIAEAETLPPGPESAIAIGPRGTSGPSQNSPITPTLPIIPGYEIVDELGRGGMGIVFKARQTKLDRLVAMKVLPAATAGDSTFAERFSREARALARLSHPHIVTVHDFGQAEGQSYLVMELVTGINLRQRLRDGPIPVDEIVPIMRQLCDAVQYAHEEGIVHRDIKPENILFDRQWRVRLADFGLAKLTFRTPADHTLTGPWQVMGTWNYMAPEQFDDPQSVDHRADVFALGVVLYEMLTGEVPRGRFRLPSERAQVDKRFDEIVVRALERDPSARFQEIRDFSAALASIAHPAPSASPDRRTEPAQEQAASAKDTPAATGHKPIGVVIVAVLCVFFWPVGLALAIPVTIWLRLTLRRPDGRLRLKRQLAWAEEIIRAVAQRTIGNTTFWAIAASLLGLAVCVQSFFPAAAQRNSNARFYFDDFQAGVFLAVWFAISFVLNLTIPRGRRIAIRLIHAAVPLLIGALLIEGVRNLFHVFSQRELIRTPLAFIPLIMAFVLVLLTESTRFWIEPALATGALSACATCLGSNALISPERPSATPGYFRSANCRISRISLFARHESAMLD
jgi:hypothetical protein